jgi:hypothetical protein
MSGATQSVVRRFSRHCLLFSLSFFMLLVLGVYLFMYGPDQYAYRDGDWDGYRFVPEHEPTTGVAVLFDQHSHTSRYHAGALTPEQNLQWHIAMGFNACVVSDKLDWEAARVTRAIAREKYDDQIKVILGIEYGTNRGHFNILLPPDAEGYEELIVDYGKYPSDEQIRSLFEVVHSIGGIVVVDHIPYSLSFMPGHPTRQQLLDWGADYIEVANETGFDWDSQEFCLRTGMGMIAGTGLHRPEREPVRGWTLLDVEEFTEEAIFAELLAKRTSLVVNPGAPYPFQHQTNWRYTLLRPLIQVGDAIEDYNPTGERMNWAAVAVLLAWAFGAFLLVECLLVLWGRRR